jgi:hypothetical protein
MGCSVEFLPATKTLSYVIPYKGNRSPSMDYGLDIRIVKVEPIARKIVNPEKCIFDI